MSNETEENIGACEGNLSSLELYAGDLAITKLFASEDNLNSDDLMCIAALTHLNELDVSHNHIDNFESIKSKSYTALRVNSQSFTRSTDSLDYSPLPAIFTQAGEANYFTNVISAPNIAVSQDDLSLDNAQFNGSSIRFVNAVIASITNGDPHPATVTIPTGSGAFENSHLQVYFTGQIVSFNDTNLCNEVYRQGETGSAFEGLEGNNDWTPDSPVVLTNACDTTKQIAMVSDGSYQFLNLILSSVNGGANVDLKGLEDFGNLQLLQLDHNSLTDISRLANMYQLQQLWLNDNNLENDDWSVITDNLNSLHILNLNNNNMNEIPRALENVPISELFMVNNGISDVTPLAYVTSIASLDLSDNNRITDFSGMVQEDSACNPSLLKLDNAGITRIPDADKMANGFTNLWNLNLDNNQITSDTISNLASAPGLGELYLRNNHITSTSEFSGITTLTKLYLDNNQITEVDGLKTLPRLTELRLSNNQISSIYGLNSIAALTTLDVKNQTLTGTISEAGGAYALPAVFSQAKTMEFPRVNGFQSVGDYAVVN
jgi:Leucine-rich repeat (LRR) protein